MPTTTLKDQLIALDFSGKAADVYLALLSMGKGTVSQIGLKANINRTTGYDILADLVGKGLASISGKEPKQEYIAENPDKVLSLLKERFDKSQTRLKSAESLVPLLKSLHN